MHEGKGTRGISCQLPQATVAMHAPSTATCVDGSERTSAVSALHGAAAARKVLQTPQPAVVLVVLPATAVCAQL